MLNIDNPNGSYLDFEQRDRRRVFQSRPVFRCSRPKRARKKSLWHSTPLVANLSVGISLLEVMCALTIASIFMLGLSQIAVESFQGQHQMEQLTIEGMESRQLARLLAFDLANSRTMTISPSRIELTGFASKSQQGRIVLRPSVVAYEFIAISGKRALIRRQKMAKPYADAEGSVSPDDSKIIAMKMSPMKMSPMKMSPMNTIATTRNPKSKFYGPKKTVPDRVDIVGLNIIRFDVMTFKTGSSEWVSMLWDEPQSKTMLIPSVVRIKAFKAGEVVPFMDEIHFVKSPLGERID